MTELKKYTIQGDFSLENGGKLVNPVIGYHTFGKLNPEKDNVVWVCHALTANSNVPQWWGDLVGENGLFNPENHFIVCANMLGSCYGSTSPIDINSETGEPYYYDFPLITMRDVVKAHLLLKAHLGIDEIYMCMGGSCGGNQVLEFLLLEPKVKNAFIIASSARESAWSIAIHSTQREAIETDRTWGERNNLAGINGLKTARGIGLHTYRTIKAYKDKQTDGDEVLENLKATSYIKYHGQKLADRYNAHSYWHMVKTLDTHHIGRGRGKIEDVLKTINAKVLLIGIDSDILIPPDEQKYLAEHIPNAVYRELKSEYGHDGFLIEQPTIRKFLEEFIK